jgi:CTP:molybdopterin cytidylyltransferase MocA
VTTAAVVLAAGGGSRYRGSTHKLLAPFRGATVVEHAIGAAVAAGLDETIVVVGAVELAVPAGVTVVRNDRWAEGLATSLRAAVDAAGAHGAVVVGLGDQPLVDPRAWRLVAAARATPVAVATYDDGGVGHPVRLARAVWDRLPATGDAGARSLVRGGDVEVAEVRCPGSPADVDTVEDLTAWS